MKQVLALRLYTTIAFKSINDPLRDLSRTAPPPPNPVRYSRSTGGIWAVGVFARSASRYLRATLSGLLRMLVPSILYLTL